MTKTYEQFRLYFESDVYFAPKDAVIDCIRKACIEFCEQVRCVRLDASVIGLSEEIAEYDINFSVGYYTPVELGTAFLGDGTSEDAEIKVYTRKEMDQFFPRWRVRTTPGNISGVFLTDNQKLRVYPIPEDDPDDELYLYDVIVKPSLTSTRIEDLIYNNYIEAIKAGTLKHLFKQKGQDWYNPDRASEYEIDFEIDIADAKGERLQGVADYSGSSMF